MDDAVLDIRCPTCSSTMSLRAGGDGVCPGCGSAIFLPDVQDVEATAVVDRLDDAGQTLVDELRVAFSDAMEAPGESRTETRGRRWRGGELPAGSVLGDFEVLEPIGHGGMGDVYKACQRSLGRSVALKILPIAARSRRFALRRFRIESTAAARLHHTNIVTVHAHGEHDGLVFYAMDLVDGPGLDRILDGARHHLVGRDDPDDDRPWTKEEWRCVAAKFAGVANALVHAHERGVIHRDVKPHNLLLDDDARLRLTDFGLARVIDEPALTLPGEIVGTPLYVAPEQFVGNEDEIDERVDVYGLGVTLYEVLACRRAFDGSDRERIMHQVLHETVAPPGRFNPGVPREIETIAMTAMARNAAQRYPTAASLATDLERFAAGQPILARRPGPLVRAARWAGVHRLQVVLMLATVAALVAGAGWRANVVMSRHDKANRLAEAAYDQLAFVDYRHPEFVTADLDRARELGASTPHLHLADALVALHARDDEALTTSLERAGDDDPRAWYIGAWAQWRGGAHDEAVAAIRAADDAGGPRTSEGWLFRGLALHFHDADEAVQSYRAAIARHPGARGLFAQATLHLARARNQQLYSTRRIESFTEADAALRQLVEHGVYGGYPHYLLSIAHRLAGEVYSGSAGARPDTARQHFDAALRWARSGQAFEDGAERSVTAEAECLERLGRHDDAIAARTRAHDMATTDMTRWEALHYRWRLRYWRGDFAGALADLAACADFDPGNVFYAHLYPGLVVAEAGDVGVARAMIREISAAAEPIWRAAGLRLFGAPDEARVVLANDTAGAGAGTGWSRALRVCLATGDGQDELERLIDAAPEAPWRLRAELDFHRGIEALSIGDRAAALNHFELAHRGFDGEMRYTYHARMLLERLRADSTWPAWLPAGAEERSGE